MKKLIIVRVAKLKPNYLADIAALLETPLDKPIPVTPLTWDDEAGVSHLGWLVAGLKLDTLAVLREWESSHHAATVLDLGKPPEEIPIEQALAKVGLRINALA